MSKYVAAKEQHDRDTNAKVAALLNAKKAKLRELKSELEAAQVSCWQAATVCCAVQCLRNVRFASRVRLQGFFRRWRQGEQHKFMYVHAPTRLTVFCPSCHPLHHWQEEVKRLQEQGSEPMDADEEGEASAAAKGLRRHGKAAYVVDDDEEDSFSEGSEGSDNDSQATNPPDD